MRIWNHYNGLIAVQVGFFRLSLDQIYERDVLQSMLYQTIGGCSQDLTYAFDIEP